MRMEYNTMAFMVLQHFWQLKCVTITIVEHAWNASNFFFLEMVKFIFLKGRYLSLKCFSIFLKKKENKGFTGFLVLY